MLLAFVQPGGANGESGRRQANVAEGWCHVDGKEDGQHTTRLQDGAAVTKGCRRVRGRRPRFAAETWNRDEPFGCRRSAAVDEDELAPRAIIVT
jgi:hypothetical protein